MDAMRDANPRPVQDWLVSFCSCIAREEHADICHRLLAILEERGMTDELALLVPFAHAVEYWRKGKDMEVLDRLNPEVRELVEAIIRKGEKKSAGSPGPQSHAENKGD